MKLRALTLITATFFGLGALSAPAEAAPGAAADSGAKIIDESRPDEHTIDIKIDTPNITEMDPKARIFTPKGWSRDAARSWPVLYAFNGGLDEYSRWSEVTDLKQQALKNDVIVVMPDSGYGGGYVNWYNGGKGGGPDWEDFHTDDLTQLVERNFRGNATRAVMGISSGGTGAMMYASRHPGMYKYAASFSGIVHITKPGIPALMLATDRNPKKNPFLKLGDPITARANWLAHDPYVNADKLRGTGLYLSSGTTGLLGPLDPTIAEAIEMFGSVQKAISAIAIGGVSEQVAGSTNESLLTKLKALGIPVTANLYGNGLHTWKYWDREYKAAWPHIMQAINAPAVP